MNTTPPLVFAAFQVTVKKLKWSIIRAGIHQHVETGRNCFYDWGKTAQMFNTYVADWILGAVNLEA